MFLRSFPYEADMSEILAACEYELDVRLRDGAVAMEEPR